jgi:hypothetical protein
LEESGRADNASGLLSLDSALNAERPNTASTHDRVNALAIVEVLLSSSSGCGEVAKTTIHKHETLAIDGKSVAARADAVLSQSLA